MRPKSYIGITGFMSRKEVSSALSAIPRGSERLVMVGVLASGKTLRGEANKYPRRYPPVGRIGEIFLRHGSALNLIHFSADEQVRLVDDLFRLHELAGQDCHGFQINVPWPERSALASYKKTAFFDRKTVVLQCGRKAMEECGGSAKKIAERIRGYGDSIDYALIDPSGGAGRRFDTSYAQRCFEELQKIEHIGFGIAGGLSADNLGRLRPLVRQFASFSIDAEGRLRDAHDDLDLEAAAEYITNANRELERFADA